MALNYPQWLIYHKTKPNQTKKFSCTSHTIIESFSPRHYHLDLNLLICSNISLTKIFWELDVYMGFSYFISQNIFYIVIIVMKACGHNGFI